METASSKRMHLLSGSFSTELANEVAERLGVKVDETHLNHFANGEFHCKLNESVRGADVFIFQTHDRPVNDAIMEQAILIDAAKRSSAKRITAVCPFFGYARQDRKSSGREPITAKLVVDILKAAGAERIVSVDLHSGQIQGFFDGPFDHLTAMPVLEDYVRTNMGSDVVIVSPDAGRVKVAERFAQQVGADLAIVHKRRSKSKANSVEALDVIGEVEGRRCILIDDMIDTAGTMCAGAEQLKRHGATQVYAMATHGVFSKPAMERLAKAPIDKVVVSDTLTQKDIKLDKIEVVSAAPVIADAIGAIFHDRSVSKLFQGANQL